MTGTTEASLNAMLDTMPGGELCRVERFHPNRQAFWARFTRHSLHALSHTQVVERTKQVLATAAPNAGVWRPFKAEDSLLAFLRSL